MFSSVLIANRGEIACRIARTLRVMGIRSVAVASEADRGALHARTADEVRVIGPAEPRASYLNIEALIGAAKGSGAQAIHPGYGFLAENAAFADAVEAAGLTFIGPTGEQVRAMGDKRAARAIAGKAGVPVVPGAEGSDTAALTREAERIGFPVMVKAALGGGGKGMRIVEEREALDEAMASAARLAQSAFGDGAVYLEKRVARARHIEVQVAGDGQGEAIHLFERECSLQRRHQKVIEECTSPAVDEPLRAKLTGAAVALARAVRYRGLGTVEFLVAPDGAFYFLEMNTRLQVEHPVTECVTGLDLVRLQLEIAAEGRLGLAQSDIARNGHAIEARVYAEDPARNFLPQAGQAVKVRWAEGEGVRVDAGIASGDAVPVHYDPILAKVIAAGATRAQALERLAGALDQSLVHGVITNLPFLRALARARATQRAEFDTEWVEREFLAGFAALATAPVPDLALA
ncbi:MAG TPA: biotin carboxylase N-terminal domain-containing protein, partial [Candidatus Eisenbacteria bacterium]|nr:biotin carboxylase N-terminal domain-containing protein [Candidatus Eisenbacteria bacterium]